MPGEGLELRLAVRVRIQNPNDTPIEYSGAALYLDLNGRKLASGVSDAIGTVPRYGEAVLDDPRDDLGAQHGSPGARFREREQRPARRQLHACAASSRAGVFGTRRFTDEGTFELPAPRE